MPGTILETGNTNIHKKSSLSSQNSRSNFILDIKILAVNSDLTVLQLQAHFSAPGSLFKSHPLTGAILGHATLLYYLCLQFPFQLLNTPYSSSLVCSTSLFILPSCLLSTYSSWKVSSRRAGIFTCLLVNLWILECA